MSNPPSSFSKIIASPFTANSTPALQKLGIGSLDDNSLTIEAQYNPKEIGVDKSVSWSPHKGPASDNPHLEYSGGQGRSLSMELLFDNYEAGTTVQTAVDTLVTMAKAIVDPSGSGPEDKKRPHQVAVVWGNNNFPTFIGVIESVSTKYTMFKPDGTPLRATCNVKLKEASKVSYKKPT